jgi:hypothetical protein
MAELSSVDYAFLAILKAEDREITNTEMDKIYRVRLVSRPFERLVAAGYIASDTKRRPYRHVITPDGLKVLSAELGIDEDHIEEGEKRTLREKQLWAGLIAFHKVQARLKRADIGRKHSDSVLTPALEQPVDLDGRIRDAYRNLVSIHGEWVSLVALRAQLGDISRPELDHALKQMLRAGDVRLEPDPLEHRISAEERNAAVHVGGEYRHKLAIGRP